MGTSCLCPPFVRIIYMIARFKSISRIKSAKIVPYAFASLGAPSGMGTFGPIVNVTEGVLWLNHLKEPSELALQLSDFSSNYTIKETTERIKSDVS